jgi:hypothetical protein
LDNKYEGRNQVLANVVEGVSGRTGIQISVWVGLCVLVGMPGLQTLASLPRRRALTTLSLSLYPYSTWDWPPLHLPTSPWFRKACLRSRKKRNKENKNVHCWASALHMMKFGHVFAFYSKLLVLIMHKLCQEATLDVFWPIRLLF